MCCRYGLPVNFQAMLLEPQKRSTKRLREVLNQLYAHLDSSNSSDSKQDVSMCTTSFMYSTPQFNQC